MLDLAHGHVKDMALTLHIDYRDVLLSGGVHRVRDDLGIPRGRDHVGIDGGEELARLIILEKRCHISRSFQTSLQMQSKDSMPKYAPT